MNVYVLSMVWDRVAKIISGVKYLATTNFTFLLLF